MLQLLGCLVILFLLGGYLIVAVVAVIQLAVTAYASATGSAPFGITWPQEIVIVAAVLGALLPGARDQLSKAAELYLRVIRYLWVAATRNTLRGEILTLVERVSERREIDRIHIVGYSFGSLVAIDVLFPASKPPTSRMDKVESLTTIGCPFDVVRMLHPAYFESRFAAANAHLRWTNIYDPIDVLGSNFRDDNLRREAERGVAIDGLENEPPPRRKHSVWLETMSYMPVGSRGAKRHAQRHTRAPEVLPHNIVWNPGQRLNIVTGLLLASVRAHAQYWGSNPHAESALGYLVNEFMNKPVLPWNAAIIPHTAG